MMLASLLFSAAMLPVVLMGVLNPEGLSFMTKAEDTNEIRVWLEPAEVVTKPGAHFTLVIMADFESGTMIAPKVEATFRHDAAVKVSQEKISYKEPFRGQTKLGTVEVEVNKEGQYEIELDSGSVSVDLPNVTVVSGKTLITSKK